MDVLELIKQRRSVRSYQNKPISEEKLKKILEAARRAPSARNTQAYKYIVVRDPNLKSQLAQTSSYGKFIDQASIILVAVSLEPDYIMHCDIPAHAVDIGIAFDHVTLVATEEGLGSCWIGGFYQAPVKEILHIPEKYKVVALLPVGYPADTPVEKPRKSLREIICYDTFKE